MYFRADSFFYITFITRIVRNANRLVYTVQVDLLKVISSRMGARNSGDSSDVRTVLHIEELV